MESLNTLVKKWLAEGLVDKLFTAVITLVVGILVIKAVIRLLTRALEKSKLEKAAYSLILSLAKVGLYLMLGLSLATSIGINVTGVVALASVLTLAVSLALQKHTDQRSGRIYPADDPPLPLRRLCGYRRPVRHRDPDRYELYPARDPRQQGDLHPQQYGAGL